MQILKYIFWSIWRVWFIIVAMVPIIILFPILFVFVISEKTYPQFFKVAQFWAKIAMFGMGFYPKVHWSEPLEKDKSYMFVSNHTSMTDVLLMLYVVKNNPFVFVGKKELSKVPLFGFFFKRVCIMVDRGNSKSRMKVFELAQQRIKQGLSICIFPEGGVPDNESVILDTFKDGAFRLAIEHQLPIVPMSFIDNKERFPFRFFSGSMGKMRVIVHPIIETTNLEQKDKAVLREEVRTLILSKLVQ